jgi:hypothetical protein
MSKVRIFLVDPRADGDAAPFGIGRAHVLRPAARPGEVTIGRVRFRPRDHRSRLRPLFEKVPTHLPEASQ